MATAIERKKLGAEQYLAENGLRSQLEHVTAELVRFSPKDPLEFICKRIKEIRDATKESGTGSKSGAASAVYTRPRLVSVLGGPASGKAVQCASLAKELGMVTVAPSELLRNEIKNGTEVGKLVGEMLHDNVVVPTEIVTKLIKKKIDHHTEAAARAGTDVAFVLDGFPRTLHQAIAFERDVAEISVVVYLECEEAVLRQRIAERSASSGVREDDQEERIQFFELKTFPVVEYFRAVGKCETVDAGARPMEATIADVLKIVRD